VGVSSGTPSDPTRKVGAALGIGILLLPWIFAWVLLRKGYSVVARLVGFGWMVACFAFVMMSGSGPNQGAAANFASAEAEPAAVAAKSKTARPAKARSAAVTSAASEEPAPEATTRLTGPQKNAVRSAKQYLRMTGFSREGLIDQLSSSAGDGYDVADATVAVDSLDVDWNANAVKSAKQYLNLTGFSCQGLIEQLSSSAGDKYTESQATYGARQAGAC
jgi:hypothetical protein